MPKVTMLSNAEQKLERNTPAIGVFVPGDPRIDADSRLRCRNIVEMVANVLAERVKLPDGSPARVVWSSTLVDGEPQADLVVRSISNLR